MASLGIVAYADDKAILLQAITTLKNIDGLKIVFVKQSSEKLYITTEKVFNLSGGMQ